MLQSDYLLGQWMTIRVMKGLITMQKLRGMKKMLTRVKSLMFSLRRVEVRLSTIALALKSYFKMSFQSTSSRYVRDLTYPVSKYLERCEIFPKHVSLLYELQAIVLRKLKPCNFRYPHTFLDHGLDTVFLVFGPLVNVIRDKGVHLGKGVYGPEIPPRSREHGVIEE